MKVKGSASSDAASSPATAERLEGIQPGRQENVESPARFDTPADTLRKAREDLRARQALHRLQKPTSTHPCVYSPLNPRSDANRVTKNLAPGSAEEQQIKALRRTIEKLTMHHSDRCTKHIKLSRQHERLSRDFAKLKKALEAKDQTLRGLQRLLPQLVTVVDNALEDD